LSQIYVDLGYMDHPVYAGGSLGNLVLGHTRLGLSSSHETCAFQRARVIATEIIEYGLTVLSMFHPGGGPVSACCIYFKYTKQKR
jgi:hypothetical protein